MRDRFELSKAAINRAIITKKQEERKPIKEDFRLTVNQVERVSKSNCKTRNTCMCECIESIREPLSRENIISTLIVVIVIVVAIVKACAVITVCLSLF